MRRIGDIMQDIIYLNEKIRQLLANENTKIAKKVIDFLDYDTLSIVAHKNANCFYFETSSYGRSCPKYMHEWLIKYVKRKTGLKYMYE